MKTWSVYVLERSKTAVDNFRDIGHLPMQIIASGRTEAEAKRLEVEMIAVFRRYGFPIVNLAAGGDANPGRPAWNKGLSVGRGVPKSVETRAKMRQPKAAEHKAKIGAAHARHWLDPAYRARMSLIARANLKAIPREQSAETRAKPSTSLRAAWARRRAAQQEASP